MLKRPMICELAPAAVLSTGRPVALRSLYVARPVEAPGLLARLWRWLVA